MCHNVKNSSINLNLNKKFECFIRKKTQKCIVLKFWIVNNVNKWVGFMSHCYNVFLISFYGKIH